VNTAQVKLLEAFEEYRVEYGRGPGDLDDFCDFAIVTLAAQTDRSYLDVQDLIGFFERHVVRLRTVFPVKKPAHGLKRRVKGRRA